MEPAATVFPLSGHAPSLPAPGGRFKILEPGLSPPSRRVPYPGIPSGSLSHRASRPSGHPCQKWLA